MLTFRRECPIVLAILSGLLIGTAHPGGAVINGTPDGTAHRELRHPIRADSCERDRVAAADSSATDDRGVHADVHPIVLGSGPQDS